MRIDSSRSGLARPVRIRLISRRSASCALAIAFRSSWSVSSIIVLLREGGPRLLLLAGLGHQRPDVLAQEDPLDVPALQEREHADRELVLARERDRRRVHDRD